MSLLESLIIVSEKAANIARLCRQDQHLFQLLVQEKSSDQSNPRFVQDFKTLADVLIQETVKHDIGRQFPELKSFIKGEEDNVFRNTIGEEVVVQIQEAVDDTANVLMKVLNGDNVAAKLLAEEVHRQVALEDVDAFAEYLPENVQLDCEGLGVWIDPIDSTAEYINAEEVVDEYGIYLSGLRCVTVLIGVYDQTSGVPVIGIINQPFHKFSDEQWHGRCHWGISLPRLHMSSVLKQCLSSPRNLICISSSENDDIKAKLQADGFHLVEVAGAGYKILTVITQKADAYLLSKNTTFKWDTCGPQAILRSLQGDIIRFDKAAENIYKPIDYICLNGDGTDKLEEYCNMGGIVAFNEVVISKTIMRTLNK
ncbi:hypothetical protein FQA39_LY01588 [Lamprigera yunnana]|nr:hypothetical protein FQA39_LY01588 [Lamprigera yunnana]